MSAHHENLPHDHAGPTPHSEAAPAATCGTACCHHAAPMPVAMPGPAVRQGDGAHTAIRILQMDCPTEEALLRKKLGGMVDVTGMDFNLMQRVLTVSHAPKALPAVLAAVRDLGFTPELVTAASTAAPPEAAPTKPWWPLALAGGMAVAAEASHWAGLPTWVAAALALGAVLASGLTTYRKGWVAIRHGQFNINALMSLAVTGALLLGQWPEAAMVMVLFAVAELIEARSLDRARHAIQGLMQLTPERATVLQADGRWQEVDVGTVPVAAQVRVRPGERIALDGRLLSGRSTVNQAPITGESLPVDKAPGDDVFAGTVNGSGAFDYEVTAEASHSVLARIVHAVEDAQGARAPTQRFVDGFSRVYTPAVCALALMVAVLPPLLMGGAWFDWVYRALVLLVIACPCALVISTPVTIVSGLAAAARQGILIKGGAHLEAGRKLAWLALDKTGTLTQGRPVQTDTVVWRAGSEQVLQAVAASLASRSNHPVSRALTVAAQQSGMALLAVEGFEAMPGLGVRGSVAGRGYLLGNHRLAHEQGRCTPDLEARVTGLEAQGKTVILLSDDDGVLGLFAVADTLKAGSAQAVAELHALGIRTLMLTGDNMQTARAIAAQVGIDEVQGEMLPEDKLRAIEDKIAQGGVVGMVGDGINDAPALARAHIGFAMGAAGTGTAIETADVALMDDDLRKLPRFVRLSRRAHALLVQNIVLALGIKAVFLTLTILGVGTMWMAVFADVGASLLVVGNGLRMLRPDRR